MEEFKNLTSAEHVLLDTFLTNVGDPKGKMDAPLEFAIKSNINFLKGRSEVSDSKFLDFDIEEGSEDYQEMPNKYETRFLINDLRFSKNYTKTLQSWKGIVIGIEDDLFVGELEDLTNGGTKEIAEFDLETVSPDDRTLVQSGAAFYWNIGYRMNNGQITKESLIRFQRLIDWDSDDFDKASDRATELFENIKFE